MVALIVTIVILLILAGISISSLTGENGILGRAKDATNDTKSSSVKEKLQLLLEDFGMEKYTTEGKQSLLDYLIDKKNKGEIDEATDNNDGTITVEVDGYEVVVKTDDLSIVSTDKVGGVRPKVETKIYQENGSTIIDGTTYDKVAITIKITNKSDLTSVDGIVLKNASGTEVTKNGSVIGDSSADASYIIEQGGKYTVIVTGTKDGVQKSKTIPITVTQILAIAGLKVGDYINYTPDDKTSSPYTTLTSANTGSISNNIPVTQDDLKWQILKINDDGSMDLIGSTTSQNIAFNGSLGYNNGVYLMNDICEKLYSKGSITARSVNLNDFEYWLKKSTGGEQARANYGKGNTYEYGKANQYKESYSYRPDIFGKTENESNKYYATPTTNTFSPASGTAKAEDTLDVKQTYYNIAINETNYGEGYKALTSGNYFWVASRCVSCGSSIYVKFGLRSYGGGSIGGNNMFLSSNKNERLFPWASSRSFSRI